MGMADVCARWMNQTANVFEDTVDMGPSSDSGQ